MKVLLILCVRYTFAAGVRFQNAINYDKIGVYMYIFYLKLLFKNNDRKIRELIGDNKSSWNWARLTTQRFESSGAICTDLCFDFHSTLLLMGIFFFLFSLCWRWKWKRMRQVISNKILWNEKVLKIYFISPPKKRKRKRKLQTPLVPLTIFEVCVAHMNNDLNASDEQATGT